MAVNGIELAVDQRWMTRGAGEARVIREFGYPKRFLVTTDRDRWVVAPDGRFLGFGGVALALTELLSEAPAKQQAPYPTIPPAPTKAPSAPEILNAAAGHMRDRAATYDKPEGERSMAQTVAVFNLHHGTSLSEAQGWHFMQVLKDVRLFTNTSNPHRDSVDDNVAYAALKGEAILREVKT